MNAKQLARLAYLDDVEFQTPAEEAEHAYLLRLQSEMQQAFETLREQGLQPTWVGGEFIIANLRDGAIKIVRSLLDARRLVAA